MAPADVESDRIAVRHDAAAAAYEEGHRLAHEGTPDGFHARALMRERVRLANRMQQQLWRYYPQFLDAVDGDVAAPWALALTTTHCAVCASGSGHEACRQEPDRDPASGGRQPPARRHLPLGSHRRTAAQRDPASHNKYRARRARGHGHARALRSVADRLLSVACAMEPVSTRTVLRPLGESADS